MADDTGNDGFEGPIDDTNAPDIKAYADAFVEGFKGTLGVGGKLDWVVNELLRGVARWWGFVFRVAPRAATYLATFLQAFMEQSNDEFAALATSVLGTMFGSSVDIRFKGDLQDSAKAVGQAVLDTVFGGVGDTAGGTLEPSTDRAVSFLGAISEMTVRGWFLSLIAELPTIGQLKVIHELEEGVVQGLGLGRLARTAMRPVATTLMADPMQWAINLSYRPQLVADNVAIQAWLRGRIDDARLDDILGRKGYSHEAIEWLINAHAKHLSASELLVLVDHDVVDENEAIDLLTQDGYEDATARHVFAVARLNRVNSLIKSEADVWLQKYGDGLIGKETFVNSLRTLALPDDVLQAYANIGGARREAPSRQLSESQLRDAWSKGVITQAEYHDGVVNLGYSEEAATTLVLLQLTTLKDQAEAEQAKKRAVEQRAKDQAAKKAADEAQRLQDKQHQAAERAALQSKILAQRQKITRDTEALQAFTARAAASRRTLVDRQHALQQIDADQAAALKASIDADEKALLASITAQSTRADVTFQRQILELQQANREALLADQLHDVDLALERDQLTRDAGARARLSEVQATLAEKLHDLGIIYASREMNIGADLADGIDAFNAAVLPTIQERKATVAQQLVALDVTLTRRLADLGDQYAGQHAAVDQALANGDIKDPAADREHIRLGTALTDAQRLAQQQHDLSVQRLTDVADQIEPMAGAEAVKQKTALQVRAASARRKLASDRLAAELAAHQQADTDTVRLQTIEQQIVPITEAEAARRRDTINTAAAAAKRNEAVVAAQIAKGEAAAQATIDKANAGVTAAHKRLVALQAASSTRESATTAAIAEQAALDAQLESERQVLQQQLDADRLALPSATTE